MSFVYAPPPPPVFATSNGGATYSDGDANANVIGDTSLASSPSSTMSVSSSIVVVIIIVSSAIIVSGSIYILLRFLSRRFSRTYAATADDVVVRRQSYDGATAHSDDFQVSSENALESLPLFSFGSVTGNLTGGDCAVCLSRFEPHDQLRLLPLCCHAFHARCIDTWLSSNQTCPLCRSTVYPTDAEVLSKILSIPTTNDHRHGSETNSNGSSFRIEIGSISRPRGSPDDAASAGDARRSYSIGSFEYIVDSDGYEVSVESLHRRGFSECTSVEKESSPGESFAAEVGGGRSWLRDYVDRLSSRAMSFRSSGRFFTGSSRRSDVVVPVEDLEANRIGEEISELFRWFSGV